MNIFKNFICNDEGVTAIEYALIISLISIAIIASVTSLGTTITSIFTRLAASL